MLARPAVNFATFSFWQSLVIILLLLQCCRVCQISVRQNSFARFLVWYEQDLGILRRRIPSRSIAIERLVFSDGSFEAQCMPKTVGII